MTLGTPFALGASKAFRRWRRFVVCWPVWPVCLLFMWLVLFADIFRLSVIQHFQGAEDFSISHSDLAPLIM